MGGSRRAALFAAVCLAVGMAACGGNPPPAETAAPDPSGIFSGTRATGSPTRAAGKSTAEIPTATPRPSPGEDDWKTLPVVPVFDGRAAEIFRRGISMRRDFHAFSKIGDCQNITTYFLAEFDHPREYRLGPEYAYLQPAIDHFAGSWSRESLAVKGGLNVAAALNPIWANSKVCSSGETPLACEIRVNNPSIVMISMEESWSGDIVKYDQYLRMIVDYVLSQDVVPILATRAEVPDPQISIDATVARIAYDYGLPLWNFWAAANPLPYHGLTSDGFHLTWAAPFFDDPHRMEMGWPWRNLTALQTIDAVWKSLNAGQ